MIDKPATRLRVFLCYAHEDCQTVRSLYERLLADGVSPWLDEEDILPGQQWQNEIPQAVKTSHIVIVCLSPNVVDKAGYMQKEMKLALDIADELPEGAIFVIPVKLEPSPLPQRLEHLHSVNLFEERGYSRLLRALQFRANQLGLAPLFMDDTSPLLKSMLHVTSPHQAVPVETLRATSLHGEEQAQAPAGVSTRHPLFLRTYADLLTLRGTVVLPDLSRQNVYRRLGRGSIRHVIPLGNDDTLLVIATGGAALYDIHEGDALWDIDCPAQCGALNVTYGFLALANRQYIHLWDVCMGELVCTFQEHTDRVTCLAFAPDGRYLVSGSSDKTVCMWDIEQQELRYMLPGHTDAVKSVAFAPDGTLFATGAANGTIRLWASDTGERLHLIQGRTGVSCLCFSPDGETLMAGATNGTVRLWRMPDGTRLDTLKGHGGAVHAIACSRDGSFLASGSSDQTVRVWRLVDGACIHKLQAHDAHVVCVAFSLVGDALVSATDDVVVQWNREDGVWDTHTLIHPVQDSSQRCSVPAKNRLFPSIHSGNGLIKKDYAASISSVAFSPDGALLAAGIGKQTVQVWRTSDGAVLHILEGHTNTIKSVAFSPDGTLLASGSDDTTVYVWRMADGGKLYMLQHTDWVRSVTFSPDGHMLAVGTQDVWVWQLGDGALLYKLKRQTTEYVTSVAFSPDGHMLVSGSRNGTARLWDITKGERVRTLRERDRGVLLRVGFVPDSATVAVVSDDKMVRLWRVGDGVRLRKLKGYRGTLLNVAFAPDGKTVAAASSDGAVRVWLLSNGTLLHTLQGHTGGVQGVAFSPDGRLLASGSEDGTVRLWCVESYSNPR